MATVPLYTRANEVSGGVVVEQGRTLVRTSGVADTLTLPLNAPVGYQFFVRNLGAGTQTLAAGSNDSLTGGVTALATNTTALVVKSAATQWSSTISALAT